jgi:hypothetical protein
MGFCEVPATARTGGHACAGARRDRQ